MSGNTRQISGRGTGHWKDCFLQEVTTNGFLVILNLVFFQILRISRCVCQSAFQSACLLNLITIFRQSILKSEQWQATYHSFNSFLFITVTMAKSHTFCAQFSQADYQISKVLKLIRCLKINKMSIAMKVPFGTRRKIANSLKKLSSMVNIFCIYPV